MVVSIEDGIRCLFVREESRGRTSNSRDFRRAMRNRRRRLQSNEIQVTRGRRCRRNLKGEGNKNG